MARRMAAYRTSVGRFQTVEDLRSVKGLGRKKLDRLKPLVTGCTIDRQMRKLPKPSDHAPVIVTLGD